MDYDHFMGIGGGLMWIIWALLVAAVVWLLFVISGQNTTEDSDDTSRKILDERYARGEIDEETYRRMKRELD